MLKGIPNIISPELMKCLLEMGHGDLISIVDGNFPAHSLGVEKIVRMDGHGIPPVLEAVLQFLPLDTFVENNVILMDNGQEKKPKIWKDYERILRNSSEPYKIIALDRFEFYDVAKQSYCLVATSEMALYANIILKKGVLQN